MSKTTFRFWHRTDKPSQDGLFPIHLVYQIQGQRKYYSIPDTKLFSVNWNADKQQAVYVEKKVAKKLAPDIDVNLLLTASEAAKINAKLQQVRKDVEDVQTRFRLDKKIFSATMIIDTYKAQLQPETKKDEPGIYIIDFIKRFVGETSEHKAGTLKEYKSLANHMEEYEKSKKAKFTFEGDASILNGLSSFLTDIQGVNNITKAKLISTFKTILRHAKRAPYKIKCNPDFLEFSVKRKDSEFEVIALSEEELFSIYNLDLSQQKSLDEVRDIFCFACATGLRYSDLAQLRREHIRKDNLIQMTAAKNEKKIEVPLNPISQAILQKHSDSLYPLPVIASTQKLISNQKLNHHIKEVGKRAGIDAKIEIVRFYGVKKVSWISKKYELLSIHVGRKTFTTLSLEKGMALQEVMSLTTHSSFKSLKRYIDVTKERKKAVMAKAWGGVTSTVQLKAI